MKTAFPAFCQSEPIENQENRHASVLAYSQADACAFEACCDHLRAQGYASKEAYTQGEHRFSAFQMENRGVFVNHFGSTGELRIVTEEDCAYFDHADHPRKACVPAQITQIALENFGMSYVVRLSDGRFIIFDGGQNIESERHKLFNCLKAGSPFERPVIAAWILTHPHPDHFHCFLGFMETYSTEVTLESFLFNFPEHDDFEHYPALNDAHTNPPEIPPASVCITSMMDWIRKSGAAVYMAHTGQRYAIGDAQLEILSSLDDTIHFSKDINATSLVIRMMLGGQVILWGTDAPFSVARLADRYGAYLKADILQIPHHGLQCGTPEGELAGYAFIDPRVCLLPVADFTAFTFFCCFRAGTRSLMMSDRVEEIITGSKERTITLPYTPPAGAMEKLRQQMRDGETRAGARMWVFTGLNTANPDDFVFTLLNTIIPPANVRIDLYFEKKEYAVRNIRTEVSGSRLRVINIVGEDVDGTQERETYNSASLKNRGIPENQPFAVRFISDVPIVVTHPHHAASYHTVG